MDPFLPFSVKKLRKWINLEDLDWDKAGDTEILKPGHMIGKPSLLFRKIEDSEIEAQVNKLLETKIMNDENNASPAAAKENISFDDFTKLDIRTATILAAEKVPKTKKLLKLTVDTGLDKRTVVSGIAEYFEAENIIGKQVSLVVNLEPRKIRGIDSQGMILMAEDNKGKLVFVSPSEDIMNGSEVK
jgi:methionyl-tRNA synthetase